MSEIKIIRNNQLIKDFKSNKFSLKEIAEKYSITINRVNQIVTNQKYKDLRSFYNHDIYTLENKKE